jgi:predicted amidohydrolase
VEKFIGEAVAQQANIVCFPESYIPGLRGQDFHVQHHDPEGLRDARERVCRLAETHGITVIMPMDWDSPEGIVNAAFVISPEGEVLGSQTKNQVAPEEDEFYVPGTSRQLFEVEGVRFGISICHEGWRYP